MPRKKAGKHLQFYMDCMSSGDPPSYGLCGCARNGHIDVSLLNVISPDILNFEQLEYEGFDTSYWASGRSTIKAFIFTPLRQTIVLFMAAINNEL